MFFTAITDDGKQAEAKSHENTFHSAAPFDSGPHAYGDNSVVTIRTQSRGQMQVLAGKVLVNKGMLMKDLCPASSLY